MNFGKWKQTRVDKIEQYMEVSVIIAFYNNIDWLKMILTALNRQTFLDFEVVIADDGSKQIVVDEIEKIKNTYSFPIQHVWHEDKGWRKNIILNKAIVNSVGQYLIFLDGDCIPHRKFVEEHYAFRQDGIVIAGRRAQLTQEITDELTLDVVSQKNFERKICWSLFWAGVLGKESHVENSVRITNKRLRKWFIKEKKEGIIGCNFSLFKTDILKVNGFDERYLSAGTGEDSDLELRLRQVGIFPLTKKHLLTVFHRKHKRENLDNENNKSLLEENTKNCIGWTQFGIQK